MVVDLLVSVSLVVFEELDDPRLQLGQLALSGDGGIHLVKGEEAAAVLVQSPEDLIQDARALLEVQHVEEFVVGHLVLGYYFRVEITLGDYVLGDFLFKLELNHSISVFYKVHNLVFGDISVAEFH